MSGGGFPSSQAGGGADTKVANLLFPAHHHCPNLASASANSCPRAPHHLKSKAGHQILSLQSHISFHLKISPLCTKDEMHNSDWQHQPPGYVSKLSRPCKIFPPRSISSHLSLCEQSLSLSSLNLSCPENSILR